MPFVDAMKEACFAVFPVYVVLTVLAWAFDWRRLLMALMVGIGRYLFDLLERRARLQGS